MQRKKLSPQKKSAQFADSSEKFGPDGTTTPDVIPPDAVEKNCQDFAHLFAGDAP
jgi:hypothetical protein